MYTIKYGYYQDVCSQIYIMKYFIDCAIKIKNGFIFIFDIIFVFMKTNI